MKQLGFYQRGTMPTTDNRSLYDNVYINKKKLCICERDTDLFSDHDMVCFFKSAEMLNCQLILSGSLQSLNVFIMLIIFSISIIIIILVVLVLRMSVCLFAC